MHRRSRSALAGAIAAIVLLTSAIALAAPVGSSGVIGGFEIDGNLAFDNAAGARWDWQNVPDGKVIKDPPEIAGADTHFGGGSKETDTNTWSLGTSGGPLPDKADLTRAYVASNIDGDSYLWLGFERVNASGAGDAHVNFELNQSGQTRTNSNGAVVPIRTNGDLLVVYDYNGGNDPTSVNLEVRRWNGNQSSGSWDLITNVPAGSFLQTINGAPITRPDNLGGGTVDTKRFGEVGLDLTKIIPGFSLCPGFATFNAKSRTSGNSFSSSLSDIIGPTSIITCPKPISTLTKGVRDVTAGVTTFASSINASPGDTLEYQVAYQNTGNADATNVQVTDQLQNRQTFESCSNSCTYNALNRTITWNLAGPIAGGSDPIDLTFQVALDSVFPSGSTDITNVANGTASGEDNFHSGTTDVTVAAAPASQLSKGVREHSDDPNAAYSTGFTAHTGDELDYRVTYQNNGNAAATNITVSDQLQPHQTLVAGSCSPSCTVSGSTLSWTIAGPVAPGAANAVTLTFSVTLDSVFPAGTTDVTNKASGTSHEESQSFDSNETDVQVGAGPISQVAKSVRVNGAGDYVSSVTASPGDTLNYKLVYTNNGNAAASSVVISDELQPHQTLVAGSCVPTCTVDGNTLSWSLGTVQPGAANAVTITFNVTLDSVFPAGTTDVTNTATCTTDQESSCSNNETHTTVTAAPASQLVKTVRNDSTDPTGDFGTTADASPGDTIDYQIVYSNTGNAPASGITVQDTLAARQTLVDGSCSPTCSVSGSTLTWTIAGPINPGAANAVTLSFQATLDAVFPAGTTQVSNVAVGASNEEQHFESPPTTVTVTAEPISGLTKGVRDHNTNPDGDYTNGTNASPGDVIDYRIVYSNTGDAAATNISVSDEIQPRQTYVDGSCNLNCTVTGSTISWTIAGPVNPGAANAVTLTFQVRLDGVFPAGTTDVFNTASGTTPQEQQSFDSNQTDVQVGAGPISTMTKGVRDHTTNASGDYATSISAAPGDTLDYRVLYENDGNAPASNITITDVVQAHQTYVTDSCSNSCAYNDATKTITWSITGPVNPNPGSPIALTFQVTLDPTFPSGSTVIHNVAEGTATGETFESTQTTVTVAAAPNLGALKSASTSDAVPGDQITYSIAYFNSGNGDATNVTITENIPTGTAFVSCDQSCSGSPAGPITWTIASVPGNTSAAHPAGTVHLTVAVTAQAACQILNTATISSQDQNNGVAVNSNTVTVNVHLGGPNTQSSRAYGAYVSLLGSTLVAPTPDTNTKNPGELLQIPLNPLAQVDLLRVEKGGQVTDANAHADAIASTGKIQVLNTGTALLPKWLVSATAIQAVSSSDADGTTAGSSDIGTVLLGVNVNGINLGRVTQPTTIKLVDPILHTTTTVNLIEELPTGAKAGVPQPQGNTFASGLAVNAIHVTVKDSTGKIIAEVVVAHADSAAQFRSASCGQVNPSVSGNGYVAGIHADETLIDPSNELLHAEVGTVNLPSTGGSQDATLAEVGPIGPTANQTVLYSNTAYSHTDGTVDAGSNSTQSNTVSSIEKLRLLDQDPTAAENYLLTADLVKAESHSTGAGNVASSSGDTTLANVNLAGTDVCAALGLSGTCHPAPNTVFLGIPQAVIVFNEQIPGPSGPGVSELRVNAIHIYVLGQGNPLGLPVGADVVISSAESDVHDVGGTVTGTPAPPGPTNVIILPLLGSSVAPKTTTVRAPLLKLL